MIEESYYYFLFVFDRVTWNQWHSRKFSMEGTRVEIETPDESR